MARRNVLAATCCAAVATALVLPRAAPPSAAAPPARAAPRSVALRAEDDGQPGMIMGGGFNAAGEPPVKIRGFSLAKAALGAGTAVTAYSFYAFFVSGGGGGTASLSSLGFIYGIPILLAGAALQYAELEPVPVEYDGPEARIEALFEAKANDAMVKIREDVTRHRYGDDAHLDTTTKALGLVEPGRPYPNLISLKLGEADGQLSYSLVFAAPETPFTLWNDERRVRKYETFFGPDVDASVIKVDAEKRIVAINLVTNGGVAGSTKAPEVLTTNAALPQGLPARNRAQ